MTRRTPHPTAFVFFVIMVAQYMIKETSRAFKFMLRCLYHCLWSNFSPFLVNVSNYWIIEFIFVWWQGNFKAIFQKTASMLKILHVWFWWFYLILDNINKLICFSNVGKETNFGKTKASYATTSNQPYDFESVMHYGK